MKILFGLICSMILGFLGMAYIGSGFLRGLPALMLIVPTFLIMGLLQTLLMKRQAAKHLRGRE